MINELQILTKQQAEIGQAKILFGRQLVNVGKGIQAAQCSDWSVVFIDLPVTAGANLLQCGIQPFNGSQTGDLPRSCPDA